MNDLRRMILSAISTISKKETNILFEKVKCELIELAVILAAFYGLRRSEVVGLKWTAINFESKTFSIRHTVTPVYFEDQEHIIEKDRAKNKPSRRTLPLVPAFEELLLRIRELQALNKSVCSKSYCADYEEYIYLDKLGQRVKPGYITQNFTRTLKKIVYVIFAITTCVIVVQASYSPTESV